MPSSAVCCRRPRPCSEVRTGWPRSAPSGRSPPDSRPSFTHMLQTQGSPAALLANCRQASASMHNVADVRSEEVGPNEWLIHQRFHDGFEPFEEYCSFSAGLFALTPRLFGFPAGQVVEEECQRLGAPACVYRVRWDDQDSPRRRADFAEIRSELLEARLEAFQRTVADLVSSGTLEEILRRIVVAAAQAVRAPAYVLAIDALPSAAQRVYAVGVDDAGAAAIAAELLAGDGRPQPGRLAVDVASTRARYGWLAAIYPDGERFLPPGADHPRRLRPAGRRRARLGQRPGGALARPHGSRPVQLSHRWPRS